jgi:hypothetical protein
MPFRIVTISLANNHRLAVSLLTRLGLTHLHLVRRPDGTYRA